MIECNHEPAASHSDWQSNFLTILPEIQRRLKGKFRHFDPAAREEAVAEGVAHCVREFESLHRRRRTHVATPATLAFYASRQVRHGRPAAGRMNRKDPLSRYGRLCNDIQLEQQSGKWIEELVEDKRARVPEQVAAKVDVGAWFATLSRRMKQVARDLAFGCSTSEVAEKHGVSAGRISQLRRLLEASWAEFQGQGTLVVEG